MLVFLSASAQEIPLKDLLPDSDALKGWNFSREPECFRGEELFDLINGGADLFYEYSFEKVMNAQYAEKEGSKIQLEIYEMDSDSSAYGIFSSIYNSSEVGRDIGLYSVLNEQYIAFVKDRYYINIAWLLKKDARQEYLVSLAKMVETNITSRGKLPELLLRMDEVRYNGIPVYFRGNIALSNVYYFDFKDHFQIDQGLAFRDAESTKLLFAYRTENKAQTIFSNIHTFLQTSRRFNDPGMIYQGYTCTDNKGNRLVFRLGEGFITVVITGEEDYQLMSEQETFFHQAEKVYK
jgi:hypothetical protein